MIQATEPTTQRMPSPAISRFSQIRNYTEELMKLLSPEDHLAQPMMDVSPPKWHLGHTTWFFETLVLKQFMSGYKEFHPQYAYYFNSYYESLGDRLNRDSRGTLTRPPLEDVYRYRQYVNENMEAYLQNPDEEALELLEIGLNHEQQHQELFLTDFKYILGVQPFHPVYSQDFVESKPEGQKFSKSGENWIDIPEDIYFVGFEGEGFSYDNEGGRHKVYLHPFSISEKLVTNGEWMEFMAAGAYTNFKYWHSDGWAWVNENKITAPEYWEQKDGEWFRFSLAGLEKVNPNDPVAHISFYEAHAYAQWKALRLPTEHEWEVASDHFNWGQRWEWTNSAYLPYPNFKQWDGAAGEYNGKFMVNQMVLRGASVATSPQHSRKTYRNFFHPHLRWQFTGLRLAK